MIELIKTIFSKFSSRKHPLIFIRPKLIKEPDIYYGDFDLLIAHDDIEHFFYILHQACSQTRHSFTIKRHRLDKLEVTLFSQENNQSVQIDIWTELDIKDPQFAKGSYISITDLLDNGYIEFDEQDNACLTDDFAATYYLSHLLSKNKSVTSPEVRKRLSYYLSLPCVQPETLAWLSNPTPETLHLANKKLQHLKLISYSLSHRIVKSWFRLKQDIRKKRKFISIVGPDGVGKTTVIETLTDSLNGKYYRFKKMFRKSMVYLVLYKMTKKHLNKQAGYSLAKNQYDDRQYNKLFWIALFNGYLRGLSLNLGRIKLIDRYYPDLLVTGTRFLNETVKQHPQATKRIQLCPTPLAYIQLDAPTEMILARKDELSAEAINHLRDDYFTIGLQLESPLFVYINNRHSLEATKILLNQLKY
jgi:thymidylate kinase